MEEMETNQNPQEGQGLNRYEQKQLKKKQAAEKGLARARIRKLKKILLGGIALAVIIGAGWFLVKKDSQSTPALANNIVAQGGIHWHASLEVAAKGERQKIPAGIGLGTVHLPVHTHEEDNIIHLEFPSSVRENDIRLKRFFNIWGEQFSGSCILEFCNGEDGTVKMFVNGEPNDEFENYILRDGDQIKIVFE